MDLGSVPLGWSAFPSTVVRNVAEAEPVAAVDARVEGTGAWRLAEPVAGLEVGLRPGTIRLAFTGRSVGRADGELVVSTTDREQPELRIPLRAEVVSEPGCRIVASPAPLRFGLVKRGDRHLRDLVLANVGTGTCLVWELRLAPGSDPDFSLPSTGAPYFQVPPGERIRVPVAFTPDTLTGSLQRATISFRTSNASDPPGAVEVTGYAADLDLVATPNPLDFGRVPLERAPHRTVRVENRGALTVTLAGHGLAAGSSPRFTVQGGTAYPAALARNQGVDNEVTYDPDRVERNPAALEVRVAGHPEPLVIGLQGEGHDGPCGDYCEPPVPVCPAGRTVIVNRSVVLDGSATDPNGDPVTCTWQVIDAPEGSTEQPRPPNACGSSFVPDAIGEYVLRLTAADDLGNEASCTTTLRVLPPDGGLWVEMYWEHNSNDIDLHLLHGDGGDPRLLSSWNVEPWDCFYGNDPASWDNPGTADDANLDRDVTSGTGVENIRIDQPSTAHPYHVGIAWYSRHGSSPTTQPVVTNVYCWGMPVASTTTTMVHPGPDRPSKPTVFVGTVQVSSDGTCSWTPDGTVAH